MLNSKFKLSYFISIILIVIILFGLGFTYRSNNYPVDVYNVYLKAMNGDDAAAEALRRFRNWLPGQNIFYAKIPLDYLIMNNVYEWANPGYLQRLERNLHNKTGQDYWFNEGLFVK